MKTDLREKEIKQGLCGDDLKQEEALCRAYDRYADPIASYIREHFPLLDSSELTTAVNDAFTGLAKKVKQGNFRIQGSLSGLLFRMAIFRAHDQLKAKYKQRELKVDLQELSNGNHEGFASNGLSDDEVLSIVARKLSDAPEIAAAWRTATQEWTPGTEVAAQEIVRQFKLWIGTLPRVQRKVAEVIATRFGDVTDEEICHELEKTGERLPLGSVKSARREIRDKFKSLIETMERIRTP